MYKIGTAHKTTTTTTTKKANSNDTQTIEFAKHKKNKTKKNLYLFHCLHITESSNILLQFHQFRSEIFRFRILVA